jgi:hypothetical protein
VRGRSWRGDLELVVETRAQEVIGNESRGDLALSRKVDGW